MKFKKKERKIKAIQRSVCEIIGCNNTAEFYVTFEDGLWAYLCKDHMPPKT